MAMETSTSTLAYCNDRAEKSYTNDDDWSGITDPKERRKRQNRLHQRSWRKRQDAQRIASTNARAASGKFMVQRWRVAPPSALPAHGPTSGPDLPLSVPHQRLHALLRAHGRRQPISSIVLSAAFPLPADHALITLVQFNVLRGMFTNIRLLSLEEYIALDCGYQLDLPWIPFRPTGPPPNFAPTATQRAVPHCRWIDTVPWPRLRDNLIGHQNEYVYDDLCDDLVGGLYEGFNDVEVRGLILWGDPWAEDGWEMSEGFVKRWGWMLEGCDEMFRATNKWRELRGEERLVIEL